MKAQDQLIKHDPENNRWGDCQRTCVAAILNMSANDVPHFCDGDPARADHRPWSQQQRAFLQQFCLSFATFAYLGDSVSLIDLLSMTGQNSPGVPLILGGKSSLGCNHVVVIQDGEIVCDPSGNGIVGPMDDGLWHIEAICPASNWRNSAVRPHVVDGDG